jgi:hypothetical protein
VGHARDRSRGGARGGKGILLEDGEGRRLPLRLCSSDVRWVGPALVRYETGFLFVGEPATGYSTVPLDVLSAAARRPWME